MRLIHLSGNPSDAGGEEAAPRGGVPAGARPAALGGGVPQGGASDPTGARGRDPRQASALGRRARLPGIQTLHLGGRQAHHLVELQFMGKRSGGEVLYLL